MIYECKNSECPQVEWEDNTGATSMLGCPWCGSYAKTMQKKCKRCGELRHIERDFYASRKLVCKHCVRETSLKRYHKDPSKQKAWREANREKIRGYEEAHRAKNIEKEMARRALRYAIKKGEMVRPGVCQECNKECKPEAHHEDYSKPLDVMFLCKKCHMARHRKEQK